MSLSARPSLVSHALKAGAIVLSLSLGVFGFASATSVDPPPIHVQFDEYIHRLTGQPADPINIIFLTTSPDEAAAAVHQVLGWGVIDGSGMTFTDQGDQRAIAWQMGLQFSRASRWHMRIEQVPATPDQSYVLAAVHRDDDSACGHVGTAFDRARHIVGAAFANAGYDVTTLPLGNTQSGPQCDGSYTAGDGTTIVIDLTKPPHQR